MVRLIERQLEVLLRRDRDGRLTTTRDPGARPAPRLHLGRSRDGHVWGVRADVPAAVQRELDRLCAAEPPLAEAREDRPPACRERARTLLAPVAFEHRGPAFVLPEGLPEDPRARVVRDPLPGAVLDAFPWLRDELEHVAPVAIAFDGDRPASICHSPRGMTDHVAEAGVETLEAHRGRGLAVAAVACWAGAVQGLGRRALYSTSWDNEASRGVARRLSARLYGEDFSLT